MTTQIDIDGQTAVGRYYTVRDACSALDGYDVKVENVDILGGAAVEVSRIRNRGVMIGDRPMSWPVAPASLFFAKKVLFTCEQPDEMEFAHDNPFGQHMYDARYTFGNIELAMTEYENACSVTLFDTSVEPKKVLYSQNYFEPKDEVVLDLIVDAQSGDIDPDTIEMYLRDIHDGIGYDPIEES